MYEFLNLLTNISAIGTAACLAVLAAIQFKINWNSENEEDKNEFIRNRAK